MPLMPNLWPRYVDDTFVIQKEECKQNFLEHINSVDLVIHFTVEDTKQDSSIPFLDTLVKPEADNTLSITLSRKPTHTDLYLQWNSHHHLLAKYSVINTPPPTGQEQYAVSQSFSRRKWTTSGKHLVTASILDGLWPG